MALSTYWNLQAKITRWVDDHQPGFVECRFTDSSGREWEIVEKVPVVTVADLSSSSVFPQPAGIGCEMISRRIDEKGCDVVEISTERPWHIETIDGITQFWVFADQLGRPFIHDIDAVHGTVVVTATLR